MIGNNIPNSALVILNNYTYPTLPPITDEKLQETVFTHRSIVKSLPSHLKGSIESYDKLAHVGDSLLNTFVACLLHAMNPESRPKAATDLRAKLVNGEINSHISRHYKLPLQVQTGRSVGGTFRASDDEAGEVYEAYLAGLFYSYIKTSSETTRNGDKIPIKVKKEEGELEEMEILDFNSYGQAFNKLSLFLKPLYQPLIEGLYDNPLEFNNDNLIELSDGSKSELNTLTQKWGLPQPKYQHEYIWPDWVSVYERKGTQGKIWKSFCTVRTKFGTTITRSGTGQGAKGLADNVAAYLVLQELTGTGGRF